MIPEFAIIGHPNEGKSSVLSTLAEDDSVRISDTPGETTRCREFPVVIDGREVIRFTDTPGFQNPRLVLSHLRKISGTRPDIFSTFVSDFSREPDLAHDCELLRPLLRGAGIIYVADGSRPVRNVDLAEMEILRLSAKPRMAILNCKEDDQAHLDQWKESLRQHFNASRMFNAHQATYAERIDLLEALKSIEQDWQKPLGLVVSSFKQDWHARNGKAAEYIAEMLHQCLTHQLERYIPVKDQGPKREQELCEKYSNDIRRLEKRYHQQIRKLFKHNIFDYTLPSHTILSEDLFASQTWSFLGLGKRQLALAGGAGGAALAAGIDLAAGGASLGLFTALGGTLGALGALHGGKNIAAKAKILGISAERIHLQVGPNTNPQFPYILLDRVLIYYSKVINWAHGRRDYGGASKPSSLPRGYLKRMPASTLVSLRGYIRALQKNDTARERVRQEFKQTILYILEKISTERDEDA